ncbi:hypothetical protein SAMN06297144_3518 [Sphingomonas guangdongensis]|uniref:Uncharacterized protein n=1 Tax=Sphingomonas guangdongensis TaxID=1141890 RepID=A0A285R7K4_9SPHN|nr:hypothetical protein [Sphingomonas guangdongensis]SOB88362.1 hypothetical protein SAMN06297144_3518 [Sphingomonas guangdongensis]
MREQIYGLLDHPSDQLGAYRTDAPDGEWTGRLNDRAWGKSANLFCYFTDIVSAEGYRLSVFFDKEYRPANGGPAMDLEPLGRMFKITTRQGKKGLSRFITAEPVDPVT